MRRTLLFFLLCVLSGPSLWAQLDSIIFKNGNYIVGEIKDMDRGVITVETDYSDSDFKIEWDGIREIYSQTSFLITLSTGRRYNGRIESSSDSKVNLLLDDGQMVETDILDIVFLKEVDDSFLSRLYAAVDVGFSITKAQNLRQLTLGANVGYLAQRWSTDLNFSSVTSNQDEVAPIRRVNGGITYRYFLPKDWYLLVSMNFLSSTEQKINLRTTGKTGLGKYLIHTNQTYWGLQAGVNYNNEDFSDDSPDRRSLEGFFGTELNMFDIGDFSLLTRAMVYPSFTESGRWRVDLGLDTKYDLPLDFYIRLGFNLNYDNQPVEGAADTDYTLQTAFGWEW